MELTDITLAYPDLPVPLAGLRIVQLTDLHIHRFGSAERRVVDVLRQRCDLLVCTGDTCSELCLPNPLCSRRSRQEDYPTGLTWRGYRRPPAVAPTIAVLRRLLEAYSGSVAPVFIQGNHDSPEFCTALRELNVLLLENETRQISVGSAGPINICAPAAGARRTVDLPAAVMDIDPQLFTIALCHFPEMSEALAAAGANLTLAGHTHGGQICWPGGAAVMTHSNTGNVYAAGLTRLGRHYTYTSRGVGCSALPVRLFCPAEVTRITLRRGLGPPEVTAQRLR